MKREKMNLKILIVEDELNIRKALKAMLDMIVTETCIASNGEEGYEVWEKENPDIIISDIRMPKLDGLEMLKQIKEKNRKQYSIVMSAYDDSRHLIKAIDIGVNSYLVKPIKSKDLIEKIKDYYEILKIKKEKEELNKKLFSESEKYRTIFEENGIVKMLISCNSLNIIEANSAALDFYKYSKEEFLGKNLLEIVESNEDEFGRYCNLNKKLKKNEVHITSTGEKKDVELYSSRIENNGEKYLYVVIIDVTERSRSLKQLKDLNATKDRLFSIIGHDLRGPLGNIKMFLQLYFSDNYNLEVEKESIMHELQKVAYNALNLLENLLHWAKIQREEVLLEFEKVKISEVLDEVGRLLETSADLKKIKIEIDIDQASVVLGDRNMLLTVFRNLISNAIKFTENGGTINLESDRVGDKILIRIKDSGVGMSEEKIKKLFKNTEFVKSRGTNGEKGTGLGLILCKDFIEKHNSDLNVKSERGVGTEFSFYLKLMI